MKSRRFARVWFSLAVGFAVLASPASGSIASWTVVPTPNPGGWGNIIWGMSAFGQRNVWAVGVQATYTSNDPLAMHWDGTSWTAVPTPTPAGLRGRQYPVGRQLAERRRRRHGQRRVGGGRRLLRDARAARALERQRLEHRDEPVTAEWRLGHPLRRRGDLQFQRVGGRLRGLRWNPAVGRALERTELVDRCERAVGAPRGRRRRLSDGDHGYGAERRLGGGQRG